jgi:S1-C subfamily serine protease
MAASAPADVRRDATVQAIEAVLPAVVNIGTKTRMERRGLYYDWWRDNWAPFAQELPPRESAGSGVIIDEAGYVLTNGHVVEGADEIWVLVPGAAEGEGQTYRAEVVTGSLKTDIALLRLRAKGGERFQAARFAADDDLLLGETVLALGNPFGLGASVSRGILSSKSRRSDTAETTLDLPDWLQTDASINPGNSGGPLINLRGEVIGINVAVLKEGQGIGFAVPVKRVTESLSEIFTPETLKGLWFGARVKPGGAALQIVEVQAESPAAKAGLQVGDLVRQLNGVAPRGFIDFNRELAAAGERKAVALRIQRGQEMRTATVRLVPEDTFFNASLVQAKIGASVQALTEALAEQLGLSRPGGLVVVDIERQGPAAAARLQRGMVIVGVEGRPVEDVATLAKVLHRKKQGQKVRLNVVVESTRGMFIRRNEGRVDLEVR